jgi:hypothetical protein
MRRRLISCPFHRLSASQGEHAPYWRFPFRIAKDSSHRPVTGHYTEKLTEFKSNLIHCTWCMYCVIYILDNICRSCACSQPRELWAASLVMTHVPLCIMGYCSPLALTHFSAVPLLCWWLFGSRWGHTAVTARSIRRDTHWNTHVQVDIYKHAPKTSTHFTTLPSHDVTKVRYVSHKNKLLCMQT